MRKLCALAMIAFLAAGCGEDSGDDGTPADRTESIVSAFSIGPGSEAYQCTRMDITAEQWIAAFTPTLESGAYRVWLAVDETPGSEGTANCNAALENDWRLLFVAGVGTGGLTLPDQVGFKLNAGEQLVLVVHLVNATAGTLVGDATVELLISGAAKDFEEAEGFLAGTFTFSIPAGQTHVVSGGCTLSASASIFAVMPYMNRLGTHARVWTETPAQTLVDDAYDHLVQQITTMTPHALDPGDRVRVEFTYVNTTGATVTFGDSAEDEQCFVMTYVSPPNSASTPYCFN